MCTRSTAGGDQSTAVAAHHGRAFSSRRVRQSALACCWSSKVLSTGTTSGRTQAAPKASIGWSAIREFVTVNDETLRTSLVPTVAHRPSVGQYRDRLPLCVVTAVPLTDHAAACEPFGRPGLPISKRKFRRAGCCQRGLCQYLYSTKRYSTAAAGCYVAHFDFDENTFFFITRRTPRRRDAK
jgi:hypothetical protein